MGATLAAKDFYLNYIWQGWKDEKEMFGELFKLTFRLILEKP